jgi:hypothetical protein
MEIPQKGCSVSVSKEHILFPPSRIQATALSTLFQEESKGADGSCFQSHDPVVAFALNLGVP